MHAMKRKFKRNILALTVLGIAALALCLSLDLPLLPSDDYIVTATLEGNPIKAELLHPPFMRGLYYVHVPEAQPQFYRWFGIAFSRQSVFVPVSLYSGWRDVHYIHTDQAFGVRLTDGKIEDHWSVEFIPNGVQFSNASLAISLRHSP